jgi:energy-coupling factor transport system permease protein
MIKIGRVGHREGTAGLHRVTPWANLFLLLGFVTAVLASPGVLVKLGVLVIVLLLTAWSGEPVGTFLRNIRFVILFAAVLFLAQALSVHDGKVLFSVGLPITDRGLYAGAEMALRFLVVLSSSFLFVLVTDPDRLAGAFVRMGIPYRYGFVLVLALRFVPFFQDEYRTVRDAQRIRGVDLSLRRLFGLRRAIRYTFLPVLVAGLTRVDSIAIAMKGRAFGLYPKRTFSRRLRWGGADWAALFVFIAVIGTAVVARWFEWR